MVGEDNLFQSPDMFFRFDWLPAIFVRSCLHPYASCSPCLLVHHQVRANWSHLSQKLKHHDCKLAGSAVVWWIYVRNLKQTVEEKRKVSLGTPFSWPFSTRSFILPVIDTYYWSNKPDHLSEPSENPCLLEVPAGLSSPSKSCLFFLSICGKKLSALSVVFNLGGNIRFVAIRLEYPRFKGWSHFSPSKLVILVDSRCLDKGILRSVNREKWSTMGWGPEFGDNPISWHALEHLELLIKPGSPSSNFCTVHVTFQACVLCCFGFTGCMSASSIVRYCYHK